MNEALLTEIEKSLEYARQESKNLLLALIYKMELALAKKFIVEQKRNLRFLEVPLIQIERCNNLIKELDLFLKQPKL